MSSDPEHVVREMFAALGERRLADLPHVMAADVIDHNKIIHGEADEPGAAFDAWRQQLDAFGELHIEVADLVEQDDVVVARLWVSGRHTGEHPRMPEPTGRSFRVEQMWWFRVENGLVTEIRAVSDRLGMFLQLGWPWPTDD